MQRIMMRLTILLSAWMPLLVFGQEPTKAPLPVPADRHLDTYAVYSVVLMHPRLSHPDTNEKYVVQELSGYALEGDLRSCITVPDAYRATFAELLADRDEQYRQRYRLERNFKITKPYDLVTADQVKEFGRVRIATVPPASEAELFKGAVDLITLGNVYFDKKRTLAAVYTWALCGGLCGFGTWRVFVRNGKGEWEEQHWTNCMTIAASRFASSAWTA
jgi:hypothetical protein